MTVFCRTIQTLFKCLSTLKTKSDTTLFRVCLKEVNFSTKCKSVASSTKETLPSSLSRFCPASTTFTTVVLPTETLSQRTFFWKTLKDSTKLRSLTGEPPNSSLKKILTFSIESELHTISLQKSLKKTTTASVIFGQWVLLHTFSCRPTLHSRVILTRRFLKK